jgi:casein kinase 1
MSAAAQVGVPVNTSQRRLSQQHPYANLAAGGYDYNRPDGDDSHVGQEAYGRTSAMISSVGAAPPALSHARADDIGVMHDVIHDDLEDPEPRGFSIWRLLTCRRCC